MPRPPNYDFERKERDRAKAAKKAEKLAAKNEARKRGGDGSETAVDDAVTNGSADGQDAE